MAKRIIYINPLKIRGNLNEAIEEVRRCLLIIYDYRCQRCNREMENMQIHHINGCPLDWRRENLMLLCASCHTLIQRGLLPKKIKIERPDVDSLFIAMRIRHVIPDLTVNQIALNLSKAETDRRKNESRLVRPGIN